MRAGPVILVIGTVAVAGWIAPGLRAGGDDFANAGPKRAAIETEPQPQRQNWLGGETVLQRRPDGHFYADATVDSYRTRFLVDTGASMIALTRADAEAIGLYWTDGDLVAVGRGASGTVYGVPVTLDRVELGGFEATGVDAAIIPEGLDVSLLGQSFLSKLPGVRIDGDRMIIAAGG